MTDGKNNHFPLILSVLRVNIFTSFPETCGLLKLLTREEIIYVHLISPRKLDIEL